MKKTIPTIAILFFTITALACSIPAAVQKARQVEKTAQAIRTQVNEVVDFGGSLLKTAQALETEHPGIVNTARAFVTQSAPLLSTLQVVATDNPGLLQTAQALVQNEIPTGEPPADIPIIEPDQANDLLLTSQYLIYSTPTEYSKVLDFYKTEMPNNGWQYLENDSHEFAHAAQLNYYKDTRTATVNLSTNPMNNSSVIVINIISH